MAGGGETSNDRGWMYSGKLSCTSSLVAQNKGGSRNFICTKDYIETTFGPEQATNMNTYKFMKVRGKQYKESGSSASMRIGGSRNFTWTKDYIEKTFGPEQATHMNTYKFMKVGCKKYKESVSSASIENPEAKKRIDAYPKGIRSAYPEDWQECGVDPALMCISKSNVKPSNSMSCQEFLRRIQFLEKQHKNHSKHMRVLYDNAGLPMPEDLEDDLMEDSDHVNLSSPSTENGGTPLTASSHAGDQSDTPPPSHHHTA